jgi:multidrug efflux pump subunit AcrB
MDMLGFSLNLVSLLAVTLVTGILVDDAIVEIENIVRHMRMGKSAWRASLEAADEIGLAVIAISVTIIAVFAPVSFMGGIAGQYFRQFGLTVAFAVFFSLAVARLITPMMSAYLMRESGKHHEERDGFLMRGYLRVVRWTVRHSILTLLFGLLIFAGSIWSATLLPSGFLPTEDAGRSVLAVELPPGSRIEDTQAVSDRIARLIGERAEVANIFVNGGSSTLPTGGGGEVRKATLTINYVEKGERDLSQQDLEKVIAADLEGEPDIRFWFMQGNGQRALSLALFGDDSAAVQSAAIRIAGAMGKLPDLANVTTSAALDRPEVQIVPLADQAAELGISTQDLSNTIRVATIGDVDASLAKFNAGDRQIPIRVELNEAAQQDLDTLSALKVTTASGAAVPLASVARIEFGRGPTTIERYDRQRRIAVEADLVGDTPLGAALEKVMALPEARDLPAGVVIQSAGDAEIMAEVFGSFAQAMGAGILMVYAVLVLLFGSFMTPIAILLSLPLSIGGAIMALAIADMAISLPVVIGILMLMGIVTKNAIMIVDFAIISQERGMTKAEAIVDAGHKRARPIIMTTIAMVAGMVPSALALGEGGEFRAPMAVAVIGGLLVSTLLSLLFVPAFYSVVDSLARRLGRLLGRFVGPGEVEETEHAGEAAVAEPEPPRPVVPARAGAHLQAMPSNVSGLRRVP